MMALEEMAKIEDKLRPLRLRSAEVIYLMDAWFDEAELGRRFKIVVNRIEDQRHGDRRK